MQSGEKQPNNADNSNNNSQWDSLKNIPKQSTGEKTGQGEPFVKSELNRIAEATGRVPDDKGVIELNLALRYKEFQKYQKLYENAKSTNTMIQQGTLEDLATAKRELEEAAYLYDENFGNLDRDQRQRELKDSYRRREDLKSGKASGGGYFEEANIARFARKDDYEKRRQQMANNLTEKLPELVSNIENSEIYQTYELNKENEPNIRERRAGLQNVGKEGLYTENHDIDWQLYPHAPAESAKTKIEVTEINETDDIVEDNPNEENPDDKSETTPEGNDEEEVRLEAEARARQEAEEKARLEVEERTKNELEHGEFDLSTPEGREKRKGLIRERLDQIKNRFIDIFDLKKAKQERINEIDLELAKTGKTEILNIEESPDSKNTLSEEIIIEEPDVEKKSQEKTNSEIEARRAEIKSQLEKIEKELQEINRKRAELQGFAPNNPKQEEELDQIFEQVIEELPNKPDKQKETNFNQSYTSYIESEFINLVGQEGIDFMTSEEAINENSSEKIAIWWNNLSEEAKREVADFEKSSNSSIGNGLRSWLQTNNIIERGPSFEV